jgi:hypothetical protein
MAMGDRHQQLFDEYVEELSRALTAARRDHRGRLPLASDPRVLGVLIEYFFRCQRLNERLEDEGERDEVEPLVFVHEMLGGTHQELWRLLAELPYMPPGLNKDDEWV